MTHLQDLNSKVSSIVEVSRRRLNAEEERKRQEQTRHKTRRGEGGPPRSCIQLLFPYAWNKVTSARWVATYSCKLPKGECALFYGGFLGFPLQSVGFPRVFPRVSQGFPWFPPQLQAFLKPNPKKEQSFWGGVNVHCPKGVSEGFLYKVLGFPGVPWVSCTVASVFEPESKERVVFLMGFPRVSQRFPWVSEASHMSRGFVFGTWNRQTFWRRGGGLPCSTPLFLT